MPDPPRTPHDVALRVAAQAKVQAAQAAVDAAQAELDAWNKNVAEIAEEMEADGEPLMSSGPKGQELQEALNDKHRDLYRAQKELDAVGKAVVVPGEPAPLQGDTGHYDDGHTLKWGQGPQKSWNKLTDNALIDPLVQEAEDNLKTKPEEPPAGKPISRAAVVGGVLIVALMAAVAIPLLLKDDGDVETGSDAEQVDDAPPSGVEGTGAGAAAGPVRYESNCTGGECFTVDFATCVWTFHYDLTILDDPEAYVGQTAVIETTGFGLDPVYEVTVGPGGSVVLDATAETGPLGGTPENGCTASGGAHYTAYLTSVGGQPTFTPDPPP